MTNDNLLPLVHSWTRQDPWLTETGGDGTTGEQSAGSRVCKKNNKIYTSDIDISLALDMQFLIPLHLTFYALQKHQV